MMIFFTVVVTLQQIPLLESNLDMKINPKINTEIQFLHQFILKSTLISKSNPPNSEKMNTEAMEGGREVAVAEERSGGGAKKLIFSIVWF